MSKNNLPVLGEKSFEALKHFNSMAQNIGMPERFSPCSATANGAVLRTPSSAR